MKSLGTDREREVTVMANTLVVGVTFVDVKGFCHASYDPRGRNLGSVKIVHGGVSRNVVENFANVGMPVSFLSMTEDSAISLDVERHLTEAGADLSHTVRAKENGIGMWLVILDENGDLCGSISRMPDLDLLEEYIRREGEKIIAECENVVLEIDLNERIAAMILDFAEKYHKKVYSIVGNMSVILAHKEFLQRTNCFICNEVEASKLFSCDVKRYSPREMVDFLPKAANAMQIPAMVITMGEQGSVYYDSKTGECGVCTPYPTNVVDTSGAGDAFFSGTVMALTRNLPLHKAVQFGARLASMTIAHTESSCPVCSDFFVE